MSDIFLTVKEPCGPSLLKEKGSKFLGYSFPITSREEAETRIEELRKEYHDSTHVCYAYRTGNGEEDYFRYNDDGEPNGTAGIPIYNEIKRAELFNVLVAVVRYYGGTKLGTGGLTRAYGGSARITIEESSITEVTRTAAFSLEIPFSFQGAIMSLCNSLDISIREQEYTSEGARMVLDVPESKVKRFKSILTERSAGKIEAFPLGKD